MNSGGDRRAIAGRWRWIRYILLLVSVTTLLTGCWNSRELNTLAIVMGIGIDLVPETHAYHVSLQIVNPGALNMKDPAAGNLSSTTVYSAVDQTLFGALRKTSQKVPRRLMYAHSQLLIIGESFAKTKGIQEIFDFFERSREYRLTSSVLISRDSDARSILEIITPLEKSPAEGITRRVEFSAEVWGESLDANMLDVVRDLASRGEPVISGIRIAGQPDHGSTVNNLEHSDLPTFLQAKGIGLFKDGKLSAWLDAKEALGILFIKNKVKETMFNIPCEQGQAEKYITINSIRSNTSIDAAITNGRPTFKINVKDEGNISEVQCAVDLNSRTNLMKLQDRWSEEVERDIVQAWEAARRSKSDIFGFGELIARQYPDRWKQMEKDWPDLFADSKIEIQVQTYLRRTGMRINSFFTEQ